MESAVESWPSPLAWDSGLSCEGLLCKSSSSKSRRRDKGRLRDATVKEGSGRCESLTRLSDAKLPLVVLLLQLKVDPGPLWHPTCPAVAGHSDRLP